MLLTTLKKGMCVITNFLMKKSEKHLGDRIIGFDDEELKVKFAKKKRSRYQRSHYLPFFG